jgi:hypothetical protein
VARSSADFEPLPSLELRGDKLQHFLERGAKWRISMGYSMNHPLPSSGVGFADAGGNLGGLGVGSFALNPTVNLSPQKRGRSFTKKP